LRRLTAGRSKGNRILNSLQNWRISQASDRGGLLRSSRRSKSAKDGNDGSITTASNSASASTSASNSNSTSTSSSSSIIQQHQQPQQLYQGHKPSTSKINETNLKRQPSIWKRFCCMSWVELKQRLVMICMRKIRHGVILHEHFCGNSWQ